MELRRVMVGPIPLSRRNLASHCSYLLKCQEYHEMLTKQIVTNDVNGGSGTCPASSSGKGIYGKQVPLDRQSATAFLRRREKMKIATWNVRTLHQDGKLENVEQEMDRLNIDILGLSEVRWKGAGSYRTSKNTLYFSGGDKHQHGVGMLLKKHHSKCVLGFWAVNERIMLIKLKSKPFNIAIIQVYAPTSNSTDEEIDKFYEDLDKTKKQCKSQEVVILMGDLNAKVGNQMVENVTGKHSLGTLNER